MFKAAGNMRAVQLKVDWVKKWLHKSVGIAQNLAAFAIVECMMFPVIFAIIYWMVSEKNIPLDGFFLGNQFIARDEGIHGDVGVLIYTEFLTNVVKLPQDLVYEMISGAVEVEEEFVKEAFDGNKLPGMTADKLIQYSKFLADRTLEQLGYEPLYSVESPFTFMKNQGMCGRTDYFSKRVSEYRFDTHDGQDSSSFSIINDDI
ncbi:hypothetical protein KUTeg_015135 [Tegillarca granosa]|uniref:Uncharacterized protein n=1 Tax=Tegillarca granosa TaxID=220873 RepID=A0ABQ9ERP8_TEGGR|nr:hypothetical protein KUTeg_015135 [Tegillarca granosa]